MGTLVRFACSGVEGKDLKSSMTAAPPSSRSFSASVCWYGKPRPSGVQRNAILLHFYTCGKESFYVGLVGSVIRNWLCICSSPLHRKTARNIDVIFHSTSLHVVLIQVLKTVYLHKEKNLLLLFSTCNHRDSSCRKSVSFVFYSHTYTSCHLASWLLQHPSYQTFTNAVLMLLYQLGLLLHVNLFLYNNLFQKCLASASRRHWRRYHDCWRQLL